MTQASSGKRKPPKSEPKAPVEATSLSGSHADSAPSSVSATAADPAPKPRDTLLITGVSDNGESFSVLRAREDRLEAGVVRTVREGEPILGELLRLTPRPESPLLCDVHVELSGPALGQGSRATEDDRPGAPNRGKLGHGGPAQVATASYRDNWDAIWSSAKKSSAPN
ncbi:MAG: uncharacterized protein JWN48_3742 [Myxococcaceae bacterium]|nr:uncharacterized protein [Myxococcaceae bacterium]